MGRRDPGELTDREREVLELLRRDFTNEQIADRLGISHHGAKYHVSQILSKLGVGTREEAAVWRPERQPWLRKLVWMGLAGTVATALGVLGVVAMHWDGAPGEVDQNVPEAQAESRAGVSTQASPRGANPPPASEFATQQPTHFPTPPVPQFIAGEPSEVTTPSSLTDQTPRDLPTVTPTSLSDQTPRDLPTVTPTPIPTPGAPGGGSPGVTAVISGDTNIFNAGPAGTNPNVATDEGNFYAFDNTAANNQFDPVDGNSAAMRLGPIDDCSVVSWSQAGVDSAFYVDIIVQNVTDLVAYQVQINYDDTRVSYLGTANADLDGNSSGFTPFRDRKTAVASEFVSFVNLPVEDQTNGHRSNRPAEAASAGTVLIGDTYAGTRSAALSADTPSGNAPEGGILVRTMWELTALSDGLLLNFDISAVTQPGTKVLVFDPANPNGHIEEQVVPETQLKDFRLASDGPLPVNPVCLPLGPPLSTTPSLPAGTGGRMVAVLAAPVLAAGAALRARHDGPHLMSRPQPRLRGNMRLKRPRRHLEHQPTARPACELRYPSRP